MKKNNKESISRPEFCVSAKDLNNMLIEIEEKNIKIYGDIIKKHITDHIILKEKSFIKV